MELEYAFQDMTALPAGYSVPEGRVKPWGTTHAVLSAKDVIGDARHGGHQPPVLPLHPGPRRKL